MTVSVYRTGLQGRAGVSSDHAEHEKCHAVRTSPLQHSRESRRRRAWRGKQDGSCRVEALPRPGGGGVISRCHSVTRGVSRSERQLENQIDPGEISAGNVEHLGVDPAVGREDAALARPVRAAGHCWSRARRPRRRSARRRRRPTAAACAPRTRRSARPRRSRGRARPSRADGRRVTADERGEQLDDVRPDPSARRNGTR